VDKTKKIFWFMIIYNPFIMPLLLGAYLLVALFVQWDLSNE
jgi:hypothetical protein